MRMQTTLMLALGLVSPASAWAAEEVEVEGVAAVVNDDVAIARDRAIDDAKRKAVEQVAGTQVSSESITENFQLVEDKIYSRAAGFVKNYKIVSELKDAGGVYRVKIKANVDTKAVAENLDQIFQEKPRVIVMVAEQNVGSKGFSYWWGNSGFVSDMDIFQTSLINHWQPRGFKFVDPALLQDKLQVKGAMQQAGLENATAVAIGRDADADIAIVGKVLVSDAGNVMEGVKMHSFHAVGTMRVLNVDTGEIVAVAEDTGVAPHVDPNLGGRAAIKALAQKLATALEQKMMVKWTEEASSARELEVVAKGISASKMIGEIQRVIKEEIRGVESIQLRRRAQGNAYFTVRVRARASDFGHDLEQKSFSNFKLALEDVTRTKVVVGLAR
jgi:hypothetical protein